MPQSPPAEQCVGAVRDDGEGLPAIVPRCCPLADSRAVRWLRPILGLCPGRRGDVGDGTNRPPESDGLVPTEVAKKNYWSTSCQVLSGLNMAISLANLAVSGSRSF